MESETQFVQPASDRKPELKLDEPDVKKLAASLDPQQLPEGWELLPADPDYTNPTICHYLYRDTVFITMHLDLNYMEFIGQFRGRPSDIIVATFPKSGTTWMQELVWRIVHRDMGAESGGGVPLEYRFPTLDVQSKKGGMEFLPLHEMEDPRLIKTHMPYHLLPASVHTSGAKVLYVSRDPRDACVSYYHFCRMFSPMMYRGTFAAYRDSFVRGQIMYGPYREHVKGYLDHSDSDNVLCVTYEQLHQDRASIVRRVATFLGRPVTDQDVESIVRHTSFEAMKANPGTNFRHWEKTGMGEGKESAFMRKGVIGDWRNYFTEEESDAFMKWRYELV